MRQRRLGQVQRTASTGEINGDAIDRFTIGHVAVGTLMGLGRIPWWGALTVAVGWEVLERGLKDSVPAAFPSATQDTTSNAVFDAMAMMLGWTAIQLFPPKS
jgi:hypothetical protein